MKNFTFIILFLAVVVALFNFADPEHTFSSKNYLSNISTVAEDKPEMPGFEDISSVWEEFSADLETDPNGVIKAIKCIWSILKTIGLVIVWLFEFIVYIIQFIIYLMKLCGAMFSGILVW